MNNRKKNVGIFIFDSVEVLDFAGPYEVFSSARFSKKSQSAIAKLKSPFNVFTFSEEKKNITATGGLLLKSRFTIKDCPKLDITIIPGGLGTRKLLTNKKFLKWLNTNKNNGIIASVCTGALLLAKAGMLHERKATTHWGALELLKRISPTTSVFKNKKFVFDKYYTSAGVSSGIDMSLYILDKLMGKTIAKNAAKYIEYKY